MAGREPFAPAALLVTPACPVLGDEKKAARALEMALQRPHNRDDLKDTLRWPDRLPETVPLAAVERFRERLQKEPSRRP